MKPNVIDRILLQLWPAAAAGRAKSRALARHYDAAQPGRRTQEWRRTSSTDANAANAMALGPLRNISRNLVRNNGWARRGKRVITNHTVGWGIQPTAQSDSVRTVNRSAALWRQWAETTQCDVTGQQNIYGLERLVMNTVSESGEALVRRYFRSRSEGLAIPMQLQVLEPDHLDVTRDGIGTSNGGRIVQGVEFDNRDRRVAYWLFPQHPGASFQTGSYGVFGGNVTTSVRVPAEHVRHIYDIERAGQARGVPWFCAAIATLADYDEFEDAQLLLQKVASLLGVFITDIDGSGVTVGETDDNATDDPENPVQGLEPAMVHTLKPGQKIETVNPPTVTPGNFDLRQLRKIASALGVTYEDLTGDYSQVNFSSARMSRLEHWGNVHQWQWQMLIPMFCDPVWEWAMSAAMLNGSIGDVPSAQWTPPPMPSVDPEKEARANKLRVRSYQATPSGILREQGLDPAVFAAEYDADMKTLDQHGIVVDVDARKRTEVGNSTELQAGRPASQK
jgi:lambda family phage portal protein